MLVSRCLTLLATRITSRWVFFSARKMRTFANTCCFYGKTTYQSASKSCFAPTAAWVNKKSALWNFQPFRSRAPFFWSNGQSRSRLVMPVNTWSAVKDCFKLSDHTYISRSCQPGILRIGGKCQTTCFIGSPFPEKPLRVNSLASLRSISSLQQVSQ